MYLTPFPFNYFYKCSSLLPWNRLLISPFPISLSPSISLCATLRGFEEGVSTKAMRKPCGDKQGNNKGAWSAQEDQKLIDYIKTHGEGCWRSLPEAAGLHRCGKSCRLRWIKNLRPNIKRGNFGQDEEDLIIKLHALLGNRWSLIAGRLPGRTDNEVKNYWNSNLKEKLINMGIDPNNHRLNQILPRLHAEPAAPVIATSTTRGSKNTIATSKLKKLSNGDNDRVSDTATCLEDGYKYLVTQQVATSGSSNIILDLNIEVPAFPGRWGKTGQVKETHHH